MPIILPLASNYFAAALLGSIAGVCFFSVGAALDPELSNDHYLLLALMALGALGGCLVTFSARRLIDLMVPATADEGGSPHLIAGAQFALAALVLAFVVAGCFLMVRGGGVGATASRVSAAVDSGSTAAMPRSGRGRRGGGNRRRSG